MRVGASWRHGVEYALFAALARAVGALAWNGRVAAGRAAGRLWWLLDGRHRRVAVDNIRAAFPELGPGEASALARKNFEHLGITAAEFLGLRVSGPEEVLARYRFEGLEHAGRVLESGRGFLALTAHLGNWELAGAAVSAAGYRFFGVARRIRNPLVDRAVTRIRERFGGTVIPHRRAAPAVLRAVRSGGIVAFVMDQRALLREAVRSTFFGRPVATNRGLAVLALRTGAPVLPCFARREKGGRHVLTVDAPLEPPDSGPFEERVRRFTAQFDAVIESAVRRNPSQWFWVHRRWRLPREWSA